MPTVWGICGAIGAGKSATAAAMAKYLPGCRVESFASPVKDIVASAFDWPRGYLDGKTSDDRAWRERADPYWTAQLGRPITPRWAMQFFGTEVLRNRIDIDFMVRKAERAITHAPESCRHLVFADVRFPNEVAMIRKHRGMIIKVVLQPPRLHLPEVLKHESENALPDDVHDFVLTHRGNAIQLMEALTAILSSWGYEPPDT